MKRFPISRAKFAKWWSENQTRRFRRADAEKCPIATAIRELNPKLKDATVGINWLIDAGQDVSVVLPLWAREFIRQYDDRVQKSKIKF